MNWIDSYSRVDEGVTSVSCRINHLLFADDLVLLASSQQCLQHALDRFSAACDRAGRKIYTKYTEVLSLCKPKAVYAASEWHYTGGGEEVQAPRGGSCE